MLKISLSAPTFNTKMYTAITGAPKNKEIQSDTTALDIHQLLHH